MLTNKKLALSLSLALATVMVPAALMAADARDVVRDVRGNVVLDVRGNCVRTLWPSELDECTGKAAHRSYLVFFDFNRSVLTSEAKTILKTVAADNLKKKDLDRVEVTGHADRSGKTKYNMALSKKRAAAVRAQLVKLGFKKSQIQAFAKGENEPLVPTADGVREPQNRRVEINVFLKQ